MYVGMNRDEYGNGPAQCLVFPMYVGTNLPRTIPVDRIGTTISARVVWFSLRRSVCGWRHEWGSERRGLV